MNKFITSTDLDEAISNIIWNAEKTLLIVSPFIKLDDYFKKLFDKHINNPHIHLIIVFGKNENNVNKSMSKKDFDYFKKFIKISIVYVPNLHAKYYGNEKEGVITSINLYDYSFKNNIEFGVYNQQSFIDNFKLSTDNEAWNTCIDIANTNEVVFIKRPVYQTKKIIIKYSKNYIKSDVVFDSTDKFYGFNKQKSNSYKLTDFEDEIELGPKQTEKPIREHINTQTQGYCIRSGKKIKFNPLQPMSKESWDIWIEYNNKDFPENYCHKTGKLSYGKTSMRNPIIQEQTK